VYSAKELSLETWPDFVTVFSQGSGWDHCQCMHFHRPHALPKSERLRTRAERAERNRGQKKELVQKGCAHGIIVYAAGEPVGWCQFGRKEELPRMDNARTYRERAPEAEKDAALWRIPCFAVLKEHRKRGAASFALGAALEAIRGRGGGSWKAIRSTAGCRERLEMNRPAGPSPCSQRRDFEKSLYWEARDSVRMC